MQAENTRIAESLHDLKFQHEENTKKLIREVPLFSIAFVCISSSIWNPSHQSTLLQEELDVAKAEINRLRGKVEVQAKRIMEIPRLEEAYLRAARGVVKQNEASLMVKEISWRRLKDEVKMLQHWKQKSQTLEDCVVKQNSMIEELTAQNKLTFSRYQSLLVAVSSRDRRAGSISLLTSALPSPSPSPNQRTAAFAFAETLGEGEGGSEVGPGRHRALSAPPAGGRTRSSVTSRKTSRAASADPNYLAMLEMAAGPKTKRFTKDAVTMLQEETVKLRALNTHKDETIRSLSKKLCSARAYPLLVLGNGETDLDEVERCKSKSKSKALEELDHEGSEGEEEDLESTSTAFLQDEQQRHRSRLQDAEKLQQEFMERIQRRKAESAPHIQAIRKAKSFALAER